MNNYLSSNRELWNKLTEINAKSPMYDVSGFRAGICSLRPLEVAELGDVTGKSLLHLQCHFGMDTLSWHRRGARVTGVDFSPDAIALARDLAMEIGAAGPSGSPAARFVQADIMTLPDSLDGRFDIVFTSYGVLCWLPDLTRWAEVIAHFLAPGGTFYIAEMHPVIGVFDNEHADHLAVTQSYFHSPEPMRWDDDGAYADRDAEIGHPSYEWTHSLSDVINAVLNSGLNLEFVHEFPFCVYNHFPFLERSADGWYRLPGGVEQIPMTFSLKARKPETNAL